MAAGVLRKNPNIKWTKETILAEHHRGLCRDNPFCS